jgi:hypothetical protein
MLIDNFKLFESLSIGAIERGGCRRLYESLDEGVLSSIANFFSKMVGGSVTKLDKILRKYEDAELDYWKDWADARGKLAEVDVLASQTHVDPIQVARYKEQRERIQKLVQQVDKKRDDVKDALTRQATSIIKDSERLKDYWEVKKAKIDEDAARQSFAEIKKSSDDDSIHDLFDTEIQRASKAAKKKEEEFKNKYPGNTFSQAPTEDASGLIVAGINIKDLMMKPIADIQGKLKALSNAEMKKVLDVFNDTINDEIKFIKATVSDKDQQFKQTSEIFKNTKPKLDYIKQLLVSGDEGGTKQEIKNDADMVTDVTKKELGNDGTDKAIQTAVKETPAPAKGSAEAKDVEKNITKVANKFFADMRFVIEDKTGVMDDKIFNHLQNDLTNLFGKLTFYYKQKNKETDFKVLQMGIVNFASEVYDFKKAKKKLGVDLSDAELTTVFNKFIK